ncbi:hypothetical protein BZG36_01297 [Bifiguratus adelaidae]|uniref:Glutamine synthetase n=1 Tax=Bifiguratus adelaidae TaxID=1938954 RepID=A0A261Y5B1_9FUNG|nr:hypothetical protein BZG36_01297 [Bifiguratus adelaidae]
MIKDHTIESIEKELEQDIKVKVAGVDIDGVLRGKVMTKSKFLSALRHGFGFCSVIFGWDIHDTTYSTHTPISSSENGYKDLIAEVDLSSFRRIPWENDIPFFLVTFYESEQDMRNGKPAYCCPRGLIKTAVEGLKEVGLEGMVGAEFEFFCFNETPQSLAGKSHFQPTPLTPGMFGYSLLRPGLNQTFYNRVFDECQEFGIPLEGWHTETGPGVFEAALCYTTAKEAADNATLFKTATKQIGLSCGVMPSFMAKPHNDLPGCSGHLHFSVRGINDKANRFAPQSTDPEAVQEEEKPFEEHLDGMSETMRHFLAGILVGLESCMAVLAPTVNSYKRLVENFWAPITTSWGRDNRLAAIRVIAPPDCPTAGTRMEVRVPGADMNPQLAIAVILRCGLWGIKNKLVIPVHPITSASDLANTQRLARSLKEATDKMDEANSIARQVLGDNFVNHYVATRKHEWQLWMNAVTDWEVKRYIELV